MSSSQPRSPSWTARLLVALLLLLAGAAAATWALARWDRAALLMGVAPATAMPVAARPQAAAAGPVVRLAAPAADARLAMLDTRLTAVENAIRQATGSAGRADALLIAFAARRAIDRGVALGYLETLLADRFGDRHPRAVATIISASRRPVRLDELVAEHEALHDELMAGGPDESWLIGLRRELGTLVAVRPASRPSPQPGARYDRARERLGKGQVDGALAETMRLPGAARAERWIAMARRYIAVHRALDEVESAALLAGTG